jgi:nucleotide-binding universal stress UspA family protein
MRIILATLDGSALSEHALPYAVALARLLDARLQLLRVIPDSAVDDGETFGYDLAAIYGVAEALAARQEHDRLMREALRERAEQYLARRAEALEAQGLRVGLEVRFGPPAEVIVEAAEGEHVDLIVMGTHGYGGVRRWALGSTADKVVHATHTPVLLVRGEAPAPAPALRRIMLPLDGSPLAQQALPLAAVLAARSGAELVLLRAVMPTLDVAAGVPAPARTPPAIQDMTESLRACAQHGLEDLAARLRSEVVPVAALAPVGPAAEVIVDEAAARHVDLIVMATHGYSGLRRWALGSTADKVLHASHTPLLLVRARE